jgi:hypothetical protein
MAAASQDEVNIVKAEMQNLQTRIAKIEGIADTEITSVKNTLALQVNSIVQMQATIAALETKIYDIEAKERPHKKRYDSHAMSKIKSLGNDKSYYESWARRIINLIRPHDQATADAMQEKAFDESPVDEDLLSDDEKAASIEINTLLSLLVEEGSMADDMVSDANGSGFEAWRLLRQRFDPTQDTVTFGKLEDLMNPDRCKNYEDVVTYIDRWEARIRKLQGDNRKTMDDPNLKKFLVRKIVPQELEAHLKKAGGQFSTWDKVKEEIIRYCNEHAGTGKKNRAVPMQVDNVDEEAHGGEEDLAALGPKGAGKGQGPCYGCGAYGHRIADCPKGKGKNKGKGKDSWQSGKGYPQNPPGLRWCSICWSNTHSTERCYMNPNRPKGKGKGFGGGGKGKGQPWGKGLSSLEYAEYDPPGTICAIFNDVIEWEMVDDDDASTMTPKSEDGHKIRFCDTFNNDGCNCEDCDDYDHHDPDDVIIDYYAGFQKVEGRKKKRKNKTNVIEQEAAKIQDDTEDIIGFLENDNDVTGDVGTFENDGWTLMSITIDSGASETVTGPSTFQQVSVGPSPGSSRGQVYRACDVTKPLGSVSKICKKGHRVVFEDGCSYIYNLYTGDTTWLREENGVYIMDVWVPPSGFTGQDA